MHPPAKFQVCSFTRFGDMLGCTKFYKGHVTQATPSQRKFVFVLVWFVDIEQNAKYQVLAIVQLDLPTVMIKAVHFAPEPPHYKAF